MTFDPGRGETLLRGLGQPQISSSAPQSHSQRKRDFLWRWLIWVIQWVEKFKLCNQIFRSNQPRVVLTTSNTYVPRKCYLTGNPKSTSQFLQFRTMPKTHLSRNSSSFFLLQPSPLPPSSLPTLPLASLTDWHIISILRSEECFPLFLLLGGSLIWPPQRILQTHLPALGVRRI